MTLCKYHIKLITKIFSLNNPDDIDIDKINVAIKWAKKYHHNQFRDSGEPFYSHPLEVACMVTNYLPKTELIITSILHDIVEDTPVTIEMIEKEFGNTIAKMVGLLTRDKVDGTKISCETLLSEALENNNKEVLIIKIFDRIHNIQTLNHKSYEKQMKTIKETLENFIVIAIYLDDINLEKFILKSIKQIISSTKKEDNKLLYIDQPFQSTENILHYSG